MKEKMEAMIATALAVIFGYAAFVFADACSISGRINYLGITEAEADAMFKTHMTVGFAVASVIYIIFVIAINRSKLFKEEVPSD